MNLVKRQFPSSSGNGVYTAVIDPSSGASSCSCRGWIFKRPGKPRECKHTKSLLAEFGFKPNGVLDAKVAAAAKLDASATVAVPKHASLKPISHEAFAKAQAEVERAVSMVKGKRHIEIEDDEPEPAKPPVYAIPKSKVSEPAKQVPTVAPVAAKGSLTAADVTAVLNGPVPPKVKPMLASAMPEDKTIEDFTGPDWVLEEKFDGHRLTLVVENGRVVGWSRPGAERPAAVRPLPPKLVADALHLPVGTYDGELFIPGGTSSDVVRIDLADKLKLVLFDVIEVLGVSAIDKPLVQRRALLELCVKHAPDGGRVLIAEQGAVSLAAVKAIWDAKGEGAILKRLDSIYRSGWRTPAWVKVKAVSAAELTITGFEPGKNGPYSTIALRHDDGRTTTVKTLGNELLGLIEKDPKSFIGRRVTIEYTGLTSSGQWRHGRLDHIHGMEAA